MATFPATIAMSTLGGADGFCPGADVLTGRAGADTFDTPASGVDTIMDFAAGEDGLRISAVGFGVGLVAGALPGEAFFAGAAPLLSISASTDGRFLYDNAGTERGTLYFDADGGSASNATPFARLSGMPALSASDFTVA